MLCLQSEAVAAAVAAKSVHTGHTFITQQGKRRPPCPLLNCNTRESFVTQEDEDEEGEVKVQKVQRLHLRK